MLASDPRPARVAIRSAMTGMDAVATRDEVAGVRRRLVDDRGAPIEQGKPLDLAACLAICVHDVGFLQSPVRTLIPPRKSCRRAFQLRGQAAVAAVPRTRPQSRGAATT